MVPETGVYALPRKSVRPKGHTAIVASVCVLAGVILLGFVWPRILIPSVVVAVAAAGSFLAFKRHRLFLCWVVAYFFFCGLIKKTFSEHITVFFLRDILLAVLYLAWFAKYPLKRGVRGRYDKFVSAAILTFVFYTFAVTLIPFTDELFIFRLGGARWWLAFIPLFFVGSDMLDTRRRFDGVCGVFLALAGVTALYGIVQYRFGIEHLYGLSEAYREEAYWGIWTGVEAVPLLRRRVFSTFEFALTFASMLRIACLLAAAYFVHAKTVKISIPLIVLLCVVFGALLLTGTRAAYVPLLVAFVTYAVLEPQRKKLVPVVASLAVGFGLVMLMSSNVYLYRITLIATDYKYTLGRVLWDWEKALSLVRDYPLGLGISTSAKGGSYVDPALISRGWQPTYRFIEHGFGQALVSLGWPGMISFAAMVVAVVGRLGVRLRTDRTAEWRLVIVFAICFSEIFPLLTHATLNFGVGPVMFWLLSGSVIAICGRGPRSPGGV